jgi:hypothetical protein
MRQALPFLLVGAAVLAGCSQAPQAPAEVLIESAPPEEIRSGDAEAPAAAVFDAAGTTRGHIAGIVVDEAIRPIAGALVRLPGMNMERPTERDGSFGFVDLYPGPYYITVEAAGYRPADALLEVRPEEFTRAKVVLTAVPPPEPYHVTQAFEGFADVTGDPFTGSGAVLCRMCEFDFYLERQGLAAVILEAAFATPSEGDQFWFRFSPYDDTSYDARIDDGYADDPLRIEVHDADLGEEDRFTLFTEPMSFPAPKASQRFAVFVTAFYNEPPPTGWSLVAGST